MTATKFASTVLISSAIFIGFAESKGNDETESLPVSSSSCFQEGECGSSLLVREWHNIQDAQQCLEQCRKEGQCQHFTFYDREKHCLAFANCQEITYNTCDGCVSGNKRCQDLQCWNFGHCDGIVASTIYNTTSNGCLRSCQDEESCRIFNFDQRDGTCQLMGDCYEFHPSSSSNAFLSAQKQCSERFTKLMIIGGYKHNDVTGDVELLNDVEVVDLENPNSTCETIADFPIYGGGQAVGIVDGFIRACGSIHDSQRCYEYDRFSNEWSLGTSLTESRKSPKSSFIDGLWLLSGGSEAPSSLQTEFWDGDQFTKGPHTPTAMINHCQLTLNSTHVFFVKNEDYKSYLLNWETQEFTEIGDYLTHIRLYPSCGLINNLDNGLEVVVAGSDLTKRGSSEIFNFEQNQWRAGPYMTPLNEAGFAQLTNTFVTLGGFEAQDLQVRDTIFTFDPVSYEWVLHPRRLSKPRSGYPGVVAVPDALVRCSE